MCVHTYINTHNIHTHINNLTLPIPQDFLITQRAFLQSEFVRNAFFSKMLLNFTEILQMVSKKRMCTLYFTYQRSILIHPDFCEYQAKAFEFYCTIWSVRHGFSLFQDYVRRNGSS